MLETVSEHGCFDGVQGFYRHRSEVIGLPMRFSVYQPPQTRQGPVPVLFYLAGLTCTEETFPIKAGAQRVAAQLGLMLVSCDTSPRDTGISGESDDGEFGICGHSMGGHGALVLALRNPQLYRSVSAFAPICAPSRCPWGRKALPRYLGADVSAWRLFDAVELLGTLSQPLQLRRHA